MKSEIRRLLLPGRKAMTNTPRQYVEKQRHYFANKGPYSQGNDLPSGHVWLWQLDRTEGRTAKNWCFWTVVLEKTPESPLSSREIKPVTLKGFQPWIFTGRTEAEAPVFWSSDVHRRLTGKVPDSGKDRGQKEKRVSEDEMAGRHHQCNKYEIGQTVGDGEGQGGLVCYSPCGHKESDTTGWLNNSNKGWLSQFLLLPGYSVFSGLYSDTIPGSFFLVTITKITKSQILPILFF